MYIKRKQIEGFPPLPKDQLKWKRIRYADWLDMPRGERHFYEVKFQPAPTEKQRDALTRGQILRHIEAAIAQAAIASRLVDKLKNSEEAKSLSFVSRTSVSSMYASLSSARDTLRRARSDMRMLNIAKYGYKENNQGE